MVGMPITRPTLTYGPVELGVGDGSSPREVFAPDQSTVSAQFKVKHEERFDAVVWFLGYAQLAYSGGPGTTVTRLERLTPKPHHDSATGTALSDVYATSVPDVRHHQATGRNSTLYGSNEGSRTEFTKSILTVGYEHVPFEVAEDGVVDADEEWRRYLWVKDVQNTTETLTLPAGSRKYVRDSLPSLGSVPYGKVVQIPITRYLLSWELLPGDLYRVGTTTPTAWQKRVWGWPTDGIKPLIGRVNSHDWLTFKAGTLLLEGVKPIQKRHPTIGLAWTFEVMLAHNPVAGWLNAYYHATTTGTSGWYFVASYPHTWYDVPDVPDDYGLYNVGRIERVFDPTG
jgi:hypothetical protein